MKKCLLYILVCCALPALAQKENYLLVGTYTGANSKSEGIYVYKFNTLTGDNSLVSVTKSSNPSFLAIAPDKKTVYAVNENADSTRFIVGGNISSFSFDHAKGTLTEISKQPSGGKHPCHVTEDASGRWVFASNYSSGSIGVLHATKGKLDTLQQVIQHTGSGPNTDRQQGPHVHSSLFTPDKKYLLVADLGTDKLTSYAFNKNKGSLQFYSEAASTPGSGPRHFDFSPNGKFVYLIEEMSGTVVCYKLNNGKLQLQQRTSLLPKDFKGVVGAADIHVSADGRFLYCSDRGDDNNISIFSIDPASGKITNVGYQSTLGKGPRNFNFDPSGNFLLVANQYTDDIIIFKVNKKTGLLTDTGKRIHVPVPVCIKWIK
ncbi:lactonase family protein [Ferruginibacter sp.]